MVDTTSAVVSTAAPAAAPAATPAAPPPSTPAPSPSAPDYSKLTDEAILDDAFAPSTEEPTAKTPADDAEPEKPAEAKEVKDSKTEEKPDDKAKPEDEEPLAKEDEPEDLKRMFKAHPEARAAWYREKAYREVFPTVADARQMRELFPNAEYAKTVLDQADTLLSADRLFVGDPATFAAKLAEGNQEAFFGMLEGARNVAYQADPARYRATYGEPVVRDVVSNLRERATVENNEDLGIALDLFEKALGWDSKAAPREARDEDPRIAKLERLERMSAEDRQARSRSFSQASDRAVDDTITADVARLVGHPSGMSEKAIASAIRDIVTDVQNALRAKSHAIGVYSSMKKTGDLSDSHKKQVVDFLVGHAKQVIPARTKAHLDEWTRETVGTNRAKHADAELATKTKDVGSSTASSGLQSPATRKVDYKTMSDDDILAM